MPPISSVHAEYLDTARTFNVKSYFTSVHLGEKASEFDHVIRKDQFDEHIATLQAAIDAEETRAVAKETELETKINNNVSVAVSDLIDSTPGALDTLNEIAAALGDDSNFAANLTAQINAISATQVADKAELEASIATESSRNQSKETALEASIAQENADRNAAVADLRADFEAGDAVLQGALDAEITRATAKESELQTALNAENSQRISEDDSIRLAMAAKDTELQSNIDTEKARAEAAEGDLQSSLNVEVAVRESDVADVRSEFAAADAVLQGALQEEVSRAMQKESELMGAITAEASTRATTDAAHSARMDAEESARQSADALLQANIDAEKARAEAAESDLQDAIDAEVAVRNDEIARVDAEAAAYKAELQASLAAEAAARAAKDLLQDAALVQEREARESDVATLANDKLDRVGGVGEGIHDFEQVKVRGVEDAEDGGKRIYVTLGKWRVATSDGYDLLFQYNENTIEEPSWKTAVPFIVCPLFQQSSSVATEFGEANDELDSILLGDYTQRTHFDTKSDDSGASFRRHIASNLAGDILVVGGPYQDNTSEDRGEAYIFTYDSVTNTWSSVELLPSSTDSARFGYSVDINDDGNRVVIGAPHHDIRKGRAYIFDYDGSDWTETSILESDPITIGDNLSYRVAMSGDGNRIAASAVGYDITGDGSFNSLNDVGATYVFDYDGSIWSQTVKLLTNDPTHNEVVGTEMKMSKDGSTIVAGSYYSNVDNNPFAGAAYVFKEVSGVWSQSTKLYDSTPRPLDFYSFTADVTRDGNKVVVGVFGDDLTEITGQPGTSSDYGSLFIYNYDGNNWTEEDKIDASDKFDYTRLQFGGSVSINDSGNVLAVGAIVVDGDPYYNGGSYIYKKIDGVWTEKQKIVTDTPDKGDYHTFFSYDLTFNGPGDKLFITAIMHDNPTTFDRIYFYEI